LDNRLEPDVDWGTANQQQARAQDEPDEAHITAIPLRKRTRANTAVTRASRAT